MHKANIQCTVDYRQQRNLRRFVRLRIELRFGIRFFTQEICMFYGKKSGKCDIELVRKIVSTQKIRELYSSQFISVHCFQRKGTKTLHVFPFVLSLFFVFIGTVSGVLTRFCSYKLQLYHEHFSDSQKARIKFATYTRAACFFFSVNSF